MGGPDLVKSGSDRSSVPQPLAGSHHGFPRSGPQEGSCGSTTEIVREAPRLCSGFPSRGVLTHGLSRVAHEELKLHGQIFIRVQRFKIFSVLNGSLDISVPSKLSHSFILLDTFSKTLSTQ